MITSVRDSSRRENERIVGCMVGLTKFQFSTFFSGPEDKAVSYSEEGGFVTRHTRGERAMGKSIWLYGFLAIII